jgi:hypothetical protein
VSRLILFVVLAGCGGKLDEAICKKVADKLADGWASPREGTVSQDLGKANEAWKNWLKNKDPNREAVIDMCRSGMTEDQAECVVAAKDKKSVAACFGG